MPPRTGDARVEARVREAFDLSWVVLFSAVEDAAVPPSGNLERPAQLLRLPNRRDLYPDDGVRVRLADGTLLGTGGRAGDERGDGRGAGPRPDRDADARPRPARRPVGRRDDARRRALAARRAVRRAHRAAAARRAAADGRRAARQTTACCGRRFRAGPALARAHERRGRDLEQVSPWLAGGVTSYVGVRQPASRRRSLRANLRASRGRTAIGPEAEPS